MPKTITLSLSDESYRQFNTAAIQNNRTISNLIETLALKKLNEEMFVDNYEMDEILSNKKLLSKLRKGHKQAKFKKGKLVG